MIINSYGDNLEHNQHIIEHNWAISYAVQHSIISKNVSVIGSALAAEGEEIGCWRCSVVC